MSIKDRVKLNLASKYLKMSDFCLKMARKLTNKAEQTINEHKTGIGAD